MAEPALRVMVVDADARRIELLTTILMASGYHVVGRSTATSYLPADIKEYDPDVILIEVDAPSRDTLEDITAIAHQSPRPIVMLSASDDSATIRQAIRAGVTAYIVDGLTTAKVRSVIDAAIATFTQFQSLRGQLDQSKAALSDHKTVDHAKSILMSQKRITEPEAHRMLQKLAMDRKQKLVDVARQVVGMADLFKLG